MIDFHRLRLEEVEIPVLSEGEALIKVNYIGICGSDLHIYEGLHPFAKPPMVLGHEFYGQLYDINSKDITHLQKGDRVTGHPLTSCGYCEHCMGGRHNLCSQIAIYGVHRDGCQMEYVKIAANRLVKIDSAVDAQVAALTEPLAVAVHDIHRSGLVTGDSVFIIGAGTIGLLLAILAEFSGAGTVVLSDIDPFRINFARELGFTALKPTDPQFDQQLRALADDKGFQRVFEASGTQSGCDLMTRYTRSGGTVVLIGIPNRSFNVDIVSIVLRELDVKGVRIHPFNAFKAAAEIINQNRINHKLIKIISKVYTLEDTEKAFKTLQTDKTIIKALINVS